MTSRYESIQTGPINCDSVGAILLCNNAQFSAPHYPKHTALHELDGVQPSPAWTCHVTFLVSRDYRRGLDWFSDLLDSSQFVTTSNNNSSLTYTDYNSLWHTSFSVSCVFISPLITALNGGRSSSSWFPNFPCASATAILS
jgi:hypothetical protein